LRQTISLWKQRKLEGNSNYKCVVLGALRKVLSELWLRISHCPLHLCNVLSAAWGIFFFMDLKIYNLTSFITKFAMFLYDIFGISWVLLCTLHFCWSLFILFFYCSKFNALYNIHVFNTIFFKKDWRACIQATVIAQYYFFLGILCTSSYHSGRNSIRSWRTSERMDMNMNTWTLSVFCIYCFPSMH
jgi:hypothetical protein